MYRDDVYDLVTVIYPHMVAAAKVGTVSYPIHFYLAAPHLSPTPSGYKPLRRSSCGVPLWVSKPHPGGRGELT